MPTLYLIPNSLSEESRDKPSVYLQDIVKPLRTFFVEGEKAARRLLKSIDKDFPINDCIFLPLNEHTQSKEIEKSFKELKAEAVGVISEAGSPCIADPGAQIVRLAHQDNWTVVALPGASSIVLALVASGLNGQNFVFNGYLPKETDERLKKIRELERRVKFDGQSQIFMETPYRNDKIFEEIISSCHDSTLLCVASNLTAPDEFVKTHAIGEWKKHKVSLQKKPAIFILGK